MKLGRLVLATMASAWEAEARRTLSDLLPALQIRSVGVQVEIGHVSYAALAASRAYAGVEATREWCLGMVEALEIGALGGQPGVYTELFTAQDVLRWLVDVPDERRSARLVCTLALARDETGLGPRDTGPAIFEFACDGRIASAPAGAGGFPYDSIFVVEELNRTLADLSEPDRRSAGARGKALASLAEYLPRNFDVGGG